MKIRDLETFIGNCKYPRAKDSEVSDQKNTQPNFNLFLPMVKMIIARGMNFEFYLITIAHKLLIRVLHSLKEGTSYKLQKLFGNYYFFIQF